MAATSINRVLLTANLTKDPELRSTGSGTSVCQMRVAANDRVKRGEEWTDTPYYFDVVVWGKQGENCAQYLHKGSPVAVDGKLTWREWQDREGNKRQSVEIVVGGEGRVQFLPTRDGGAPRESDFSAPIGAGAGEVGGFGGQVGGFTGQTAPADDDIPF